MKGLVVSTTKKLNILSFVIKRVLIFMMADSTFTANFTRRILKRLHASCSPGLWFDRFFFIVSMFFSAFTNIRNFSHGSFFVGFYRCTFFTFNGISKYCRSTFTLICSSHFSASFLIPFCLVRRGTVSTIILTRCVWDKNLMAFFTFGGRS